MSVLTESSGGVDVSVVVPAYNVGRYVGQALRSALANDKASIEVIVVNDGSTDDTLGRATEVASGDPRVRVIDRGNAGYGSAFNRGVAESTGTYVAVLEPDDWVRPGMYDALALLACRTRDADGALPDVVKSSYWRVWLPGTPRERLLRCAYHGRVRPASQPFRIADAPRLVRHHPSIWSAVYLRSFLDREGIRMVEAPGAGWVDNPFLFETMLAARSIAYTDEAWYCYREDLPGSSSATRDMMLSLTRWNDMADVCERRGCEDEGVLRALYVIGFRYVGEAMRNGGLDDPEAREAIVGIFGRMRPELVAGMDDVSPSLRRLAYEMTGRPVPRIGMAGYAGMLVRETVHTLADNGPVETAYKVGTFLSRKARGAV